MPLPTGTISFDNIRTEMRNGLGDPGAYAPAAWGSGGMPFNDASFRSRLTDTAQSTQLSISAILGNAYQRFTIAADTQNYNIRNALTGAGWNGTSKGSVDLIINSGIVVSASSTGVYAVDSGGSWPGPSSINVYNNGGYIIGMGGAGGAGAPVPTEKQGSAGAGGGPGLLAQRAMTLINTGTVAGGGGGGGGGESNISANPPVRKSGGGGGGGGRTGRTLSSGGAGGVATAPGAIGPGIPGAGGSFSGAGVGGGGGQTSPAIANWFPGGAGGGWGAAGAGSGSATGPGGTTGWPLGQAAGGAAGVAVQGWSVVTRSPQGTITGPVAG